MIITKRLLLLFNSCLSSRSVLVKQCQRSNELSNIKIVNHSIRLFCDEKKEYFNSALTVRTFEEKDDRSKEAYLEVIRKYESQGGRKIDRVQFIYAALKYMEEFQVNKDLECYKKLLDTFPKGKMIPTNIFQAGFMHYPKEQKCATFILEKMEDNGVIPDLEMQTILLNVFGKDAIPMHKYWRMMYWFPKFKHVNPWPIPIPTPDDSLELAKLAISKISSVDHQTEVKVYQTDTVEDSIDKTWIVSAMAPTQKKLLENHHPRTKVIYVEGPFNVWVANKSVDYFVLLTKMAKEEKRHIPVVDLDDVSNLKVSFWDLKKTSVITYPSVHEQVHETIFSVCATGTSSKDSVLSWIRCLEKENPVLSELHIVFTLKQKPQSDTQYLEGDPKTAARKNQQKEIEER